MTKNECIKWHAAHPYGARDEAYMDAVLAEIKLVWLDFPSERLGQLICNRIGGDDPFNALDEEFLP